MVFIIFYHRNLKDCLMKLLILLLIWYSLLPALSYFGNKARVKFDGSCLKQDKIVLTHEKNNEHTSFIYIYYIYIYYIYIIYIIYNI